MVVGRSSLRVLLGAGALLAAGGSGIVTAPAGTAAPAGPAGAAAVVAPVSPETVAAALRQDPVYVDPSAELAISDKTTRILRRHLRAVGSPVFVAVLPSSTLAWTDGVANRTPGRLRRAVGVPGSYAVVTGNKFRAASDVVDGAAAMATGAFQSRHADGVGAVLDEFADRLASGSVGVQVDTSAPPRSVDHEPFAPGPGAIGQPGDGGLGALPFVVVGLGIVGVALAVARGAGGGRGGQGGAGWSRSPWSTSWYRNRGPFGGGAAGTRHDPHPGARGTGWGARGDGGGAWSDDHVGGGDFGGGAGGSDGGGAGAGPGGGGDGVGGGDF